ncbi:hypothetical protein Agub_g4164 [Astrephomene gubernaculifera]|uniref:Maintenance of Photosystem II under High light 2 C-terminal domain-containing protein n=1 Tax=Astrephomene gubernaculifera TaxID=47775 RepID=A0AAD3DLU3_9CHLO|nr:hypothetical protein Agub_g4164 [Astrephomene gubernaculifera]
MMNVLSPARAPKGCRTMGVACHAVSTRRVLLGVGVLPVIANTPKALALIPDEEDERLLEKAKANRRARLAQQRSVTRDFMAFENLTDGRLGREFAPAQKAIYKLARAGYQMEAGDLNGAAVTLSEPWVMDFSVVAISVSGADDAGKLATAIKAVQLAAAAGDVANSKRLFVSLISDVKSWASVAGLRSSLKGL